MGTIRKISDLALPLISACSFLASVQPAFGEDFILVQDGHPQAVIVTATSASENARAAAKELQHYVRKITGAELSMVTDDQQPNGSLILVGPSRLTEQIPGLAIPSGLTPQLREEGFVLWCRGDRLVAAGNDASPYYGTRYAVAELLHRCGVRWFMAGEFGEVIPRTNTLAIPEMDVCQRPAFPMRNYWQHHRGTMGDEDTEWKLHHKMNPRIQEWFGVPGDSSIRAYLPNEAEFKAHPEWFALRQDGTRDHHMVCMTSTGMIAHFVQRVKAEARAGKRFSAFAPDDGMPRCYCAGCQQIANGFDGYGSNDRDPLPEASISNEWFHFVNAVLEEVNQEFPDYKIVTNGYANRDIPPELPSFNQRHNLVVMFANICACTLHAYDNPQCWQMQRQGQMIRQWARLCDKVWLYNYNYTMLVNKFTITPVVSRVRRNIPLLKESGVLGFHDQDEADWSLTGIPTRLVRAALEWDTTADVDALLEDFYRRWFGRAAVPMKSYYNALENAFATTTAHGHEDVVLNSIYTPDLMKNLAQEIQLAEQQAQSKAEKLHVNLERKMFAQLQDYVAMEAAKRQCQYDEAARLADALMQRQGELNRISPFLGYEPYAAYGPDWEAKRMRTLAAKTDGSQGKLGVMLPEVALAHTDPFDNGRYERWQEPGFNEQGWKKLSTTTGWDNQGFADSQGHAYRGLMWYRLEVDMPADLAGKSVWLCAPALVNEAWVWVNGQYAGHRAYQLPWFRPQALELPVSPLTQPGQRNQITFRVLNNVDVFGASGIYERMFLYVKPLGGRVVFLGDSITYSGQFVEFLEASLRLLRQPAKFEFINVGLPSETVSGLSEPGHAGGAFPRPDLHERLDRVLQKTKPDLVVACYGMNDGIYYPFSEERFEKFQTGMRWLHERVTQAGVRIVHVTPPVFDPVPIKDRTLPAGRAEYRQPYEGYNDVLDRYSEWLLARKQQGWEVVDIHGPMNRYLAEQRQRNPAYHLAGDGVHPNETGHWLMAFQLLKYFGGPKEFASMDEAQQRLARFPHGALEVLQLVQQQQRLLKDAWLTDIGHQRPGMNKGLPLPEAQKQATELEARIKSLIAQLPEIEMKRDEAGMVTLTSNATNGVIRYTLDDSEPQREAGPYLAPIALPQGGTVKARFFAGGDMASGGVTTTTFEAISTADASAVLPHSAIRPVTQNRDWRLYDWAARHAAIQALVRARKPDLVFIGDSITHFFGGEPAAPIANGGEVWQKFYAHRNAINLGFGWDRTENVLWRLQHGELEGCSPKVVVLLIGTNNLGVNTPEEIADGISAICGELRARLPQTRILLLGLLPRSPRPDALRPKLAAVNTLIAKLGERDGIAYLDIGAHFVDAEGNIPQELMQDYLHPTAQGYAVLTEAIEPTLINLFSK